MESTFARSRTQDGSVEIESLQLLPLNHLAVRARQASRQIDKAMMRDGAWTTSQRVRAPRQCLGRYLYQKEKHGCVSHAALSLSFSPSNAGMVERQHGSRTATRSLGSHKYNRNSTQKQQGLLNIPYHPRCSFQRMSPLTGSYSYPPQSQFPKCHTQLCPASSPSPPPLASGGVRRM